MTADDPSEGGAVTGGDTQPPEAEGAPAVAPTGPLGPGIAPAPRLAPPPVPAPPAPRWVALAAIVDADGFALRDAEAVGTLAESIARQGQQTPVDLRPVPGGFQLLAGHRRLAAVRLLHRSRILAQVHEGLDDEAAWHLALADDLDRRPYSATEREAARTALIERGVLTPRLEALLDRADAQAHPDAAGEEGAADEEEIELEALAARVRDRLADDCNDVAALYEDWGDLDEGRRADLLECVAYLRDMYPLLAATEQEDPEE